MKFESELSVSDIFFITVFSLLVFFGAFFIFSEVQTAKVDKEISIQNLDQMMNRTINERLKSLQGKKILFNSKMSGLKLNPTQVNEENLHNLSDQKYDLEVFDTSEELNGNIKTHSGSTFDQALFEASYDDGNLRDKEDMVNVYRARIIKMAAEKGWRVEVDQDLNITKAEPIK